MMDTNVYKRAFSLFWFLLLSASVNTQKTNILLCVPEDLINECHTMANLFPGLITCISAKDKFACMGTIARGEADTMNVDPEDLYLAGSIFGLEPFLMEEYERRRFRYRAAVLIPKSSDISSINDLKGKKSCHTGYGRNAGWYMPMGQLISERVIQQDCRSLLHTASNFFSQSCLPGRWSIDPLVDKHLKRQHPKLCELCKDPFSCSDSDEYAGYEGAIKCLLDGRGQVAFTTIEATVQLFGKLSPDLIEEYQFLCPNGAREKINYNACDWGKRPNNVWVIRPDRLQDPRRAQDRKLFYNFLEQIHFRNKVTPTRPFPPLWFDKVFVSSVNVTNIVKIVGPGGRDTMTYGEYLSEYVNSINLSTGCNKKIIRLCTSSQAELFKCLDLQKVAYSRRITPEIRCENPGYSLESCIKSVASGSSDIISLEAGDFYKAARYRGLKPIARERSNGTNIASYAVAVVRIPSEINSLQDLANASACSTGFGDISGWISPIGSLISQGLIPRETCSRSSEVSRFFRSMCVPGAGDYRYNVNVSGADVLCRLCSGDGKGGHICEKSSLELYNGETGAFRCLGERKGDVAFVSHSTPLRFTDRQTFNSNEYWATSLRSDDFRLLCSSGAQAPIKDYEKCHIAQVPSRFIVTRNNINYENYTHIVSFLSSLSEVFTGKARYSFKLFGHYEGESNLLFGDTTDSIVALDEDADYTQELGQFLPILKNMDQIACENSAILLSHSNRFFIYILAFISNWLIFTSWN